ncbi:hypothetical protein BZA70DRAFT_281841 [Myxozyma melibiosi]|uniref:37S ribosomal protein S22 n=1 Tax=Myxozyma melibiosi TaxID=54550 RepID=A0ABR1F304_9ASCO
MQRAVLAFCPQAAFSPARAARHLSSSSSSSSSPQEDQDHTPAIPAPDLYNRSTGRATISPSRPVPNIYVNKWTLEGGYTDRFHPHTLIGKSSLPSVDIPPYISALIGGTPQKMKDLRAQVQVIYERLSEASRFPNTFTRDGTPRDDNFPHRKASRFAPAINPPREFVAAYNAALVPQNFTAAVYALSEARRRLGPSWRPERVLDIGHGPAVGLLALDEVFEESPTFRPKFAECTIIGTTRMLNAARELLNSEYTEGLDADPTKPPPRAKEADSAVEKAEEKVEVEEKAEQKAEETNPVGFEGINDDESFNDIFAEIDTPTRRTSLCKRYGPVKFTLNRLPKPTGGNFDLIIVNQYLLFPAEAKSGESDKRLKSILELLAPGGVLVLVERGNLLGFERIARAREKILQPKSGRLDGIPEDMLREMHADTLSNSPPHGDPKEFTKSKDESIIDFEPLPEDEVTEETILSEQELRKLLEGAQKTTMASVRSDLRVIAPCPHQNHCPLQLRHLDEDARRKDWCHFPQLMQKPKYLLDLKRGKQLASSWSSSKKKLNKPGSLAGKGRIGSRSHELAQVSYLVVQKAPEQSAAEELLPEKNSVLEESMRWPRLINQPLKRDKHVYLDMCSPHGFIERWTVSKGTSQQEYHDARKANWGDLWALDAKKKLPREIKQSSRLPEPYEVRKSKREQAEEEAAMTANMPEGANIMGGSSVEKIKKVAQKYIKKEQAARSMEELEKDLEARHRDHGLSRTTIFKADPDYEMFVEKYGETITDEYWSGNYNL